MSDEEKAVLVQDELVEVEVPLKEALKEPSLGAKLFTEAYGTFMLVLVIACSVAKAAQLAPLAIGLTLTAGIYAGGHISGAHYNPAVSIAYFLTKIDADFSLQTLVAYIASQLTGATLAAFLGYYITGAVVTPGIGTTHSDAQIIFSEAFFTAMLVSVVLNTACTKSLAGNDFYGLSIGLTVLAGACSVGAVSGGAFNPAVGSGLLFASAAEGVYAAMSKMWYFWVGPVLGGLLAVAKFKFVNAREYA